MRAYYNEFDRKAAAWLRELIARGLIAPGDVDTRDIREVRGADLAGYTQCHFFAGIGGWSYALRLAGWPDDIPVWTGSCPCQPFSCAGKGKGVNDSRHLWPEFARLIGECRPATVFGEQVASHAGREWLAGVFADLEGMAYRRAGADLCAAGVGAPHIRQRLWWVANASPGGFDGQHSPKQIYRQQAGRLNHVDRGANGRLADAECDGGRADEPGRQSQGREIDGRAGGLGHAGRECDEPGRITGNVGCPPGEEQGQAQQWKRRWNAATGAGAHGAWSAFDLLPCRDGKTRRVESGTFPLAYGVPARVVRLRGYGNAIVPQVAAVFIRAAIPELTA